MVFNASTHVHKAGWAGFPQLQKYFSPSVLPIWDSDGINREKKKKKILKYPSLLFCVLKPSSRI